MTVRGLTAETQHDCFRTVAGFAAFLDRSPSTAKVVRTVVSPLDRIMAKVGAPIEPGPSIGVSPRG